MKLSAEDILDAMKEIMPTHTTNIILSVATQKYWQYHDELWKDPVHGQAYRRMHHLGDYIKECGGILPEDEEAQPTNKSEAEE